MIYNDSAGKTTMSKCQRTDEFMRKVSAFLYYLHMTTYDIFNCNFPCVFVQFHTKRRFCANLSVMVSNSSHPVTYYKLFLRTIPVTNYNSRCQYAQHNNIHFCIILIFYMRRYFSCQPFTRARYTPVWQNTEQDITRFHIILQLYIPRLCLLHPVICARKYCSLQKIWFKKPSHKISLCIFFSVRVRVRITVK